jgi:hypothetical protein
MDHVIRLDASTGEAAQAEAEALRWFNHDKSAGRWWFYHRKSLQMLV